MIVTLRRSLLVVVLAGGVLLAAAPAPARAQGPNPATQSRFISMMLNRNARAIQHQFNAINQQNRLLAREQLLANIVPSNLAQARAICNQLDRLGQQIALLNNELQPGKFRIIQFLNQTGQALAHLASVVPPNWHGIPVLQRQEQTFAQQLAEAQSIINRPPATPFVTGIACQMLGEDGGPNVFLQNRSTHPRTRTAALHTTHTQRPRPQMIVRTRSERRR